MCAEKVPTYIDKIIEKKNQTTLTGDIEEKIISMYAKGMTAILLRTVDNLLHTVYI